MEPLAVAVRAGRRGGVKLGDHVLVGGAGIKTKSNNLNINWSLMQCYAIGHCLFQFKRHLSASDQPYNVSFCRIL